MNVQSFNKTYITSEVNLNICAPSSKSPSTELKWCHKTFIVKDHQSQNPSTIIWRRCGLWGRRPVLQVCCCSQSILPLVFPTRTVYLHKPLTTTNGNRNQQMSKGTENHSKCVRSHLWISITSSAIMRPILPAPALVPPGMPGTVCSARLPPPADKQMIKDTRIN